MTRARLDQHFLSDPVVADRIVAAADIGATAPVLEIGPGRGVLTERLLDKGARLTAVELDSRLSAGIEERFQGRDIKLINADFLRLDLSSLPSPVTVVSNLPYSVGTPILQRLLDWPGWSTAVLMLQKEVAQRITAGPGDKKYGILSVSVALKAEADELFLVPRGAFSPPPQVESAVLRITRLPQPRLPEDVAEKDFFAVVRAAFAQRRKMAVKSLAGSLGLAREDVEAAFEATGLSKEARAEVIGLDAFVALARRLRGT